MFFGLCSQVPLDDVFNIHFRGHINKTHIININIKEGTLLSNFLIEESMTPACTVEEDVKSSLASPLIVKTNK